LEGDDGKKLSYEINNKISFFHQTGSSIEHDPVYLMEREVVVVTINYRLGAFGFLALDVDGITGNAV
jgi:hypothetical protein